MNRLIFPLLFASLAVFSLAGCGPDDGKYKVRGVVLVDGEPLPQANVVFVGGGGGRFATASTNKNGEFVLRATPGPNKVSISAVDVSNAEAYANMDEEELLTGTQKEMEEAAKKAPKSLVAQRFSSAETSGITLEVQSGMDEVTINVSKE